MDGMLSQEEINALFSGMSDSDGTSEDVEKETTASLESEEALTEMEKDAIGEISNINMGTAATTLYSLVGQKVNITTPNVTYESWEEFSSSFDNRPCVALQIAYKEGLDGNNVMILKVNDVKIIADLMMGGDGTNTEGELTDLHLSAISEAMNQMMGSSATSLSSMINRKIDIMPPIAKLIDFHDKPRAEDIASFLSDKFVKISFEMKIGEIIDSEIMQLFPLDFAKNLYQMFANGGQEEEQVNAGHVEQQIPEPQMQQPGIQQQQYQEPQYQEPQYQQPIYNPQMSNGGQNMQSYAQQPTPTEYNSNINVQSAQFQSFAQNMIPASQKENIDLIMDVPLEVTVELGRTNKSIKEILEFAPGTIIELNKIAGEPIDVLVNGKHVAKGEVVVIEENFGIRVTEIIKQ